MRLFFLTSTTRRHKRQNLGLRTATCGRVFVRRPGVVVRLPDAVLREPTRIATYRKPRMLETHTAKLLSLTDLCGPRTGLAKYCMFVFLFPRQRDVFTKGKRHKSCICLQRCALATNPSILILQQNSCTSR